MTMASKNYEQAENLQRQLHGQHLSLVQRLVSTAPHEAREQLTEKYGTLTKATEVICQLT